MSKVQIGVMMDRKLWLEFKIAAIRKFEGRKGALMMALEEAIRKWLEENKV